MCSICKAHDHLENDCKKGKKVWVRKEDAPKTSESLLEGKGTSPDPTQVPAQPQQSAGDQQSEKTSQASTQQAEHVSSVQRSSEFGVKSSSRPGKENNHCSSSIGQQNSVGSSNKLCVLVDHVEEPQRA